MFSKPEVLARLWIVALTGSWETWVLLWVHPPTQSPGETVTLRSVDKEISLESCYGDCLPDEGLEEEMCQ